MAWSPNATSQQSRHECTLSQVGSHPNVNLDIAGILNTNKQTIWQQKVTHIELYYVVLHYTNGSFLIMLELGYVVPNPKIIRIVKITDIYGAFLTHLII